MKDDCLPPVWPRPPRPPVAEPEPGSLDEHVDWMTYSHPELYAMVHQGVDLTGAMAVSARWARLGDELSDIADELTRLLVATGAAWEGESADLARESVSALADWSRRTGAQATEVSGCVTIQVDNATVARNAMPAPPYRIDGGGETPSQLTAFVSGDFATARSLVADPETYANRERALHQQAAGTMERFQESSREVYATVPAFGPPDLSRMPFVAPVEPTPQPPVPPAPVTPLPVAPRHGVAPRPGAGAPPGPPGAPSSPAPRTAPGPATPVEPRPAATAAPAAPAASANKPAGTAPGAGGVPVGGAGQRGEDVTRRGNKYVEEDQDIWGHGVPPVVPPVIGEVNRRA